MRSITITKHTGESLDISLRSLTKKEIKDLKEFGYGIATMSIKPETMDGAVEAALEKVLSPQELEFLDDCPNKDTLDVWGDLISETYGSKAEEKNLPTTTGGLGTESGSNTAADVPEEK